MKSILISLLLLMVALTAGCPSSHPAPTPPPPAAHSVTITWTEETPGPLTFSVWKQSGPSDTFSLVATNLSAETYTDTIVDLGDNPCYTVTATNANGTSVPSNVQCALVK